MADYAIPWKPLDLSPGAAMIIAVNNANRQDERSREYLDMEKEAVRQRSERESAALKRQEEDDKRKRAIEAWSALPSLQRMATKSPEMANANPYGVKIEAEQAPGPSLRDAGINVMGGGYGDLARATLASHGQIGTEGEPNQVPEQAQPNAAQVMLGQHSGFGQAPMGQHAPTRVANEPGEPPHDETAEAEGGMERAQELLTQPHEQKLFATMGGQRFELPKIQDTTGMGAKYDALYQRMLEEPGVTPAAAFKAVMTDYEKDQAEAGRSARLEKTLGFRATDREDKQEFVALQNKLYKNEPLTNAEREKLIELAGKFKVAAAAPGLKQEAANDRAMSLLERATAGVKNTAQFGKLAASDKMNRTVMMNIANGTTPLQHRDAQISLARIFRQAQPTEGEMHLLYNNLGGTMDKWNQFVARMETGDLSAEQLRQLRISAHAVMKEHQEDLRRFQNVAKAKLGPGGGFDLLPDQAQAAYQSLGSELGLDDLPPLYTTEGGIQVGSGKRPMVQPRGTKKTALDEIESQLDALGGGGGR